MLSFIEVRSSRSVQFSVAGPPLAGFILATVWSEQRLSASLASLLGMCGPMSKKRLWVTRHFVRSATITDPLEPYAEALC